MYSVWRKYINYGLLGYSFPVYTSGDLLAHDFLAQEKNLKYQVVPAAREAYRLDKVNRKNFCNLRVPHAIIMAKDDNRIAYEKIRDACAQNKYGRLYAFPSGRHTLPHSIHQSALTQLIIDYTLSKDMCPSTRSWGRHAEIL